MKDLPNFFIIPLFVGLVGFLLASSLFKKAGMVAGISTDTSTPVELAQATEPMALVVREAGVVLYQLPNSKEYISLRENQINVPTGTTLRTESTALAHVVFPDNSLMSLDEDTEILLNFEGNKIKIFQVMGSTWHRVQKILEGHSYEVETPNTLATVRGTEFNVNVLANNESEVYVIESVVEVAKIGQENGQTVTKETQLVEKDKHIHVPAPTSQEPLKLTTMPEEKKNTDWFKRNEKLTEEIKKAEELETTTAPLEMESFIDSIKEKVIKDFMDTIQENTEMQKVDEHFGIVRPESEEVSNNEKNQNEDSTSENVLEIKDVGGMARTIENEPSPIIESEKTDTPFVEPTDFFESKNTSDDSTFSQEETQQKQETEEGKDSENPDVSQEPDLAEKQNDDNPNQSAASSFLEMINDSIQDLFDN